MPAEPDDLAPLEKMRSRLYKPGAAFDIAPSSLSARASKMPRGWDKEPEPIKHTSKISGSLLFLIIAAGFFVIAGIVAFFFIIQGGLSVSSDRVQIRIEGPTTIAGGDTVPLLITIENRNPAAITDAVLSVDFPEGTYDPDDPTKPLTHHVEELGSISPGESVKRTVRATLFGKENESVSIPVSLEYHTEGTSSAFEKEETYEFMVGSSPVSVNVVALSEVASGQPVTFDVTVRSNASTPLDNVAVRAEYPFGFAQTSADPAPAVGTLFSLGTFAPGEEKKISITGTLTGQDSDERVFRFSAGNAREDGSPNLAVSFITKEALVTITRPFIAVNLSLDRSQAETVTVRPGVPVQGIISWSNTLPSQVLDAELTIALSGSALDRSSIETSGFYRSSNTSIVFDRDSEPALRTLQPGDTGQGTFSFAAKSADELSALRNPSITLTVSVAGRRVGESGVAERITSTLTRTVKVASALALSTDRSRVSGPYPPEPDAETIYAIRFEVDNGVNAVADASVKATLPTYVRFVGGDATYNETTREITWSIGELPAHASNRQASFQVALTPSTSQSGSVPVLVSAPTFSGFDRYVQGTVTATAPAIDSGGRVK